LPSRSDTRVACDELAFGFGHGEQLATICKLSEIRILSLGLERLALKSSTSLASGTVAEMSKQVRAAIFLNFALPYIPVLILCPAAMEKGRVTGPLISLIVPVWDDDDLLVGLMNRLPSSPQLLEWVVAAVDPSPALRELEDRGHIRLVACRIPSRGKQLNAGAAQAQGSVLCFHHADSELLPEHVSALVRVAADETVGGGAFHRRFDDRHVWMMRWAVVARGLSAMAGPLFGDQSIFVKADVFKRLGGFADIPLMEDVEFSSRLRRVTRVKLLDPPLSSSPRRFQSLGNWRSTLLNILFIALFYLGISPNILHRWYYQERRKSRGAVS
jgi:hypothetical protein